MSNSFKHEPTGIVVSSNGSAVGNDFVRGLADAMRNDKAATTAWVALLRAQGFVAAHPDDGWVNREGFTFQLVYPDFEDGVRVGALVALGTHKKWRAVRVTAKIVGFFGSVVWGYEAAPAPGTKGQL